MDSINIHDAKTNLSKILKRVSQGEEVIISRRGVPIARLCPLKSPEKREPGLLKGKVDEAFFDPLPDEELQAWES